MDPWQDRTGRGEGALEDALRLRAETVPIGVGVTYATVAALAVWVATTWQEPHRTLIAGLLVLAAVSATAIALAPTERIVRSRWREAFFSAWSGGDIVLVTVLAAADGGARSPTTLMYFLTLVFAATSYPLWLTGVIAGSSVTAFLGLVLLEPATSRPAPSRRGCSRRSSASWRSCASGRPGSTRASSAGWAASRARTR